METPGKSSLHGFRTHPQDYVMVFFAPDTKALCQPVIEIPVLRHKTGRVAHPDHAHAIETIEHWRSEEHTSELQSLMRSSYAVFCLKKKKQASTNNYSSKRQLQQS